MESERQHTAESLEDDTEAIAGMCEELISEGELTRAEVLYKQAIERGANELLVEYANLLADWPGRESDAESAYRRAIESGDAYAHANLGVLLEGMGRAEDALEEYRRGAESGDALARRNYGILLARIGRPAEGEYQLVRAIDEGDAKAKVTLANLLVELGRLAEAEGYYESAVRSGLTEAYVSYGMMLAHELMRPESAMEKYRAAIVGGAGGGLAYLGLGRILLEQGERGLAERAFRDAISHGEASAHVELGLTMAATGRLNEAEAHYRDAIAEGEGDAHIFYGRLLLACGRYEEAEVELQLAMQNGDVDAAYLPLAYVLDRQGRAEEATQLRRESLRAKGERVAEIEI